MHLKEIYKKADQEKHSAPSGTRTPSSFLCLPSLDPWAVALGGCWSSSFEAEEGGKENCRLYPFLLRSCPTLSTGAFFFFFCLYLIGQNSFTWLHPDAKEAEKCNLLAGCTGAQRKISFCYKKGEDSIGRLFAIFLFLSNL